MPTWRSLANSLVALSTTQPLQAWYSWQPQMARYVLACLEKDEIDVVHVEHLRGVKYGLYISACGSNHEKLHTRCSPADCVG